MAITMKESNSGKTIVGEIDLGWSGEVTFKLIPERSDRTEGRAF